MKKALILVEGQSEETFVKRIVSPHLWAFNVIAAPTIIATKRVKNGPDFKGGIPRYSRVRKEVLRLLGDSSAALVTTMIDFYGLPDSFPGRANPIGGTALERVAFVEKAFAADIANERFLAYCSLHEFEALLFSSPGKIAEAFAAEHLLANLLAIRNGFASPEDIDDSAATSPSARLRGLFQQYSKPFYGVLIASRIGLETIRSECAHFHNWLARLEALSETSNSGVGPA